MRDAILEALRQRYEAHIAEAHATINIYLENSVGIGEHPQHLEEVDKQLEKISQAEEKLDAFETGYAENPKALPDAIEDLELTRAERSSDVESGAT